MEFESILFEALSSPFGIELKTSSPENLRAKLYPIRKANPQFAALAFVIPASNPTGSLWIVKKAELL